MIMTNKNAQEEEKTLLFFSSVLDLDGSSSRRDGYKQTVTGRYLDRERKRERECVREGGLASVYMCRWVVCLIDYSRI